MFWVGIIEMKINKAVIPAAGLGTRMQLISKGVPKEMLAVCQKPMIQYAVEEAVDYGIETIVIIINSEKEIIKRYFLEKSCKEFVYDKGIEALKTISLRAELIFLYQDQPKGLADAIDISREIVKNDPFALLLPDNVFFSKLSPLKSLALVFQKYQKDVCALIKICANEFKLFGNCGKFELEKISAGVYSIKEIKDKGKGYYRPALPRAGIRGFGRHILFPHFFEYIDRVRLNLNGELDDVPVFQLMLHEKVMLGCLLDGKGWDVGNPLGYQAANEFAQIKASKPII